MDPEDFLYDDMEATRTRFVSFAGETQRFDLALVLSNRFYGKVLVLDLQSNRFGILGPDDLEAPGYLASVYQLSEEGANELHDFLASALL